MNKELLEEFKNLSKNAREKSYYFPAIQICYENDEHNEDNIMKIIDFAYECWMEDRNMDNSLVDYVAFILNATKELGHNLDYLFNTNVIDVIHYYNEENNITELFKYAILDLWKNNIVTSCSLKGHLYMRNIIVNYLTEQGRNSTFKKAIDNYEKYCQSHYILGREIERKFGKQDFDVNIFDFDKEYLDEQNNAYTVKFVDNKRVIHKVEISVEVYKAFDKFELEDISQIHKYRSHIEHSELFDETLNNRAMNKPKSIDEEIEEKILFEELKNAINQLSDIQKRRIKMYYFDDMNLREIAEKEGCAIMSVKDTINIGLNKLEEILKKFKN